MKSKNETVLITGASSGIGAVIAEKYASSGYAVLLLGRNQKKLHQVKKLCIAQSKKQNSYLIQSLAFNLNNLEQNKKKLLKQLNQMPPLKILINNAGIFAKQNISDTQIDHWLQQFQTNLFSAVELTHLAWPFLKKNSGSIVNIASTLGIKPTLGTSAYSASKAAMINWTLALAQEGGADRIRANCICPGIVDTPIHEFHNQKPAQKSKTLELITNLQLLPAIGQPEYIAEAAFFLGSEASNWTTGAILNVDGGIHIK